MAHDTTIPDCNIPVRARIAAVAETVAVFAAVHVCYRAFKRFTTAGQWESDWHLNYSPGLFMIIATLVMMQVARRQPSAFGLVFVRWKELIAIGATAGVLAALGAMTIVVLGRFQIVAGKPPPSGVALIGAVGEVLIAVGLLRMLRRQPSLFARVHPVIPCIALAAVCTSLPIAAAFAHRPIGFPMALSVELLVCAGFGEEAFFRGYVQSRLNEAFGRPWRIIGAEFGPGLLVSALLFGLVHALNTTDYFEGRFEFAWAWGVMNVCVGLCFGLLRERTGSILPGVVAHAVTDILVQLPSFVPRV